MNLLNVLSSIKSWFTGLSTLGKIGIISTAVMVGGASSNPPETPETTNQDIISTNAVQEPSVIKIAEPKTPVITNKTETETITIPFKEESVKTDNLAKGKTQIKTYGVNGEKAITYNITLIDGVEESRTSTEKVTKEPINQVILIGTYVEPEPVVTTPSNCDPNYSGCVPIASDVDCAGGSGDGPVYVTGPVQVIGRDIYGLDRDKDGWGCN